MKEEERKQVLEAPKCKVTRSNGLGSLEAMDSDTDVRFLQHRHVIRSIANRHRRWRRVNVVLYQSNETRLLPRGEPAGNDLTRRILGSQYTDDGRSQYTNLVRTIVCVYFDDFFRMSVNP